MTLLLWKSSNEQSRSGKLFSKLERRDFGVQSGNPSETELTIDQFKNIFISPSPSVTL